MARGFTLVEVLLFILVVGITSAILLPAILRSSRNDRIAGCQASLRGLWEGQLIYRARHGEGSFPEATGSAFWLTLSRTSPAPVIPPTSDAFKCPLAESREACDYRGPRRPVRFLGQDDPIGLDREGNHGPGEGGTAVYLSGRVTIVVGGSRLWTQALEGTAP